MKNQWTDLIVRGLFVDVEAREEACEAEAGALPETEPLMLLTREENEILKDTVGMIK